MLLTIIAIITALYWLGLETNGLRVRLLVGREITGLEIAELQRAYNIRHTPLCGWLWIKNHRFDLADFSPQIVLSFSGITHTIKTARKGIVKEIMRINLKPSKQPVLRPARFLYGMTLVTP